MNPSTRRHVCPSRLVCRPSGWVIRGLAAGALVWPLALTGCGEEEADPVDQLESSLENAEDSLENAGSAIEELRSEKDELQGKTQELQTQLTDTATKQVNLYKTRLADFEQRITELPAEREQEFSGRLNELRTATDGFEQTLSSYTQQAGDAGASGWQDVEAQLQQLTDRFESFTSDLESAVNQ